MATMINTANDVVGYLKGQHQEVKAAFEKVLAAHGKDRETKFYELRRMMAVHETAEEEIVHPAARAKLPHGETIVAARLREENAAKVALSVLERLDVDSAEFDSKLRALQKAVLAHAESEEKEEFSQLGNVLDAARLKRMRQAAEFAESIAPTRPHAGIESAAGNMLVGPFVAMVDRVRDAMSKKSS